MFEETEEAKPLAKLDVAALCGALWDRRWYLLIPLFAGGIGGLLIARSWPYLYRSEALILVEQQRIPESFVASNVALAIDQRLDQMTQRILSRSRLLNLIEQFQLYRDDFKHLRTDEIVDRMQSRIRIELVNGLGKNTSVIAFRVRFSYSKPSVAQQVANELTSMLIDESLSVRAARSEEATSFFEAELNRARQELAVQEEQLKEYKTKYVGELPEQIQGNLQMLSILHGQLQATESAVDRAVQQKVYLETLRAGYRPAARTPTPSLPGKGAAEPAVPSVPPNPELILNRKRLAEMKLVYKPQHPDVQRLEALIALLEAAPLPAVPVTAKPNAAPALPLPAAPSVSEGDGANQQHVADLEGRLKAVAVEIETQLEIGRASCRERV